MSTPRLRRLKIALTLSLIANVFLAGIVIGILARDPPFLRRGMGEFAALPDAERATVREAFGARSGDLRRQANDFRRAQRQTTRLLAAEPLDQAAAEAALRDLRERSLALQAVFHNAVLAAVKTTPPADRERMIRSLLQATRQGIPLAHLAPGPGWRSMEGS
ncbi:MAG: periplasmic heavy metal sensor [Alphaproteobacteria bacterium]|nr:periplasmic heavy metal sensor [Alphaproteobacteria bacterium]